MYYIELDTASFINPDFQEFLKERQIYGVPSGEYGMGSTPYIYLCEEEEELQNMVQDWWDVHVTDQEEMFYVIHQTD